jgi:flavin reductase (DIM6/NTAB) family NADH-FMN oxidoreductase RutF
MIETAAIWEALDSAVMRRAMGRFVTGVAVVTAAEGPELHGMTVNSLTSVSLDPPSLLVCLMAEARTTRAVVKSRRFNVSILDRDGDEICRAFSCQGVDHYDELSYELDADGIPLVSDTMVDLRCAVSAVHEHGDHLIVVGAVDAVRMGSSTEPLVYYGGRFHDLQRSPNGQAPPLLSSFGFEWEWRSSGHSW